MQKIYDPEYYRVVFFSSAPIGTPFLTALHQDPRFEVVGVVTQQDKPVGRGLKLTPNVIKQTALELGIQEQQIQTPRKINLETSIEGKNFYDRLQAKSPDFLVVIAYGKIMPVSLLELPTFAPINVHGSLLPQYRGASPLQSVFLDQQTQTGITIMHMDAGMDTGAIVDRLAFKLPFDRTVKTLIEKIQETWPQFLNDTLRSYAKGSLHATPQDESQSTTCQKITKHDGEIAPSTDSLASIYAKYRAYALRPKIWFTHQEKTVVIESLILDADLYAAGKDQPLWDSSYHLHPAIKTLSLKPEGKKSMDRTSFKNGYLKEKKSD